MKIRHEVLPFIGAVAGAGAWLGLVLRTATPGALLFVAGTAGLLYFFRDPERTAPPDSDAILAGADGRVMLVTHLNEPLYLQAESVRISIFLSLLDVHVNRAPMAGYSKFLGHFPGRRFFAFREKPNITGLDVSEEALAVRQIKSELPRRERRRALCGFLSSSEKT